MSANKLYSTVDMWTLDTACIVENDYYNECVFVLCRFRFSDGLTCIPEFCLYYKSSNDNHKEDNHMERRALIGKLSLIQVFLH